MSRGYTCQIETAASPFSFGIHRTKKDAPPKSPSSVSVVFRVEDYEERLTALKAPGLVPESTEKDASGQFAHFHDLYANDVTIWGK